jgi:predicted amidophosphoribosyltransferase
MLNNTTINFNRHSSINLWAVLDWLFPPFCVNCQKIGYEICPACWDSIERLTPSHTCPICGKANLHGKICAECRKQSPTFDQLKSWARYQGAARNIVTGIKYQRRLGLVPLLTPAMAEAIRAWGIHADLMTPVPLGKKRLHERGYNQADLIAKPVAKMLALPYSPNALSRIRETRSQVGLNAR